MDGERSRLDRSGLALKPDQKGGFGIIAQIDDPDGNLSRTSYCKET